jgi:hypothetical protein
LHQSLISLPIERWTRKIKRSMLMGHLYNGCNFYRT